MVSAGARGLCMVAVAGLRAPPVLVHGRDRGLEVALGDLALLQGAAPELPFLLRTAPERQNDRQGYLPFPEIVADILAEFGRCTAVVERVVDELKRDTEVQAIAAASRDLGLGPPSEQRADFRSGAEQGGRLGTDHREVIVLARRGILGGGKLHDFAFGDYGGRGRERIEARERAHLDHHFKSLAKEEVADENARLVAP